MKMFLDTYVLLFLSLFDFALIAKSDVFFRNNVHDVLAISGMLTNLPCNITPPDFDDSVNLVLWYKDGYGKPLYSFDLRLKKNGTIGETSRAIFQPNSKPTSVLSLFGVKLSDQGLYSCRVDFKKSQTRYWRVNLTVIEPPTSLQIFAKNMSLQSNVVHGLENTSLEIVCKIYKGNPNPSLFWKRNNVVFDETYETKKEFSQNILAIKNLRPEVNGTTFTCIGNNNNKTDNLRKSVTIVVHTLARDVRIQHVSNLTAGAKKEFVCSSVGAYPNPNIKWYLNDNLINQFIKKQKSKSVLSLVVKPKHHKSLLSCGTYSIDFSKVIWSNITLKIEHAPVTSIQFGKSLSSENIVENDDIYFDCVVTSNPKLTKISWLFNNERLISNEKVSFIDNSLVIQKVNRSHSGNYKCQAYNKVGEGLSNVIFLNVKYPPSCISSKRNLTLGDSKKIVRAMCQVDSNPRPESFWWWLNSTESSSLLPAKNFTSESHVSIGTLNAKLITPNSILSCQSKNEIGMQTKPCFFQFHSKRSSLILKRCSGILSLNLTLIVECFPKQPFDNSVGLIFVLEVYDKTSKVLLLSKTNRHYPYFTVPIHKSNLELLVYSTLNNVKKDEIFLRNITLKMKNIDIGSNWKLKLFHENIVSLSIFSAVVLLGAICVAFKGAQLCCGQKREKQFCNTDQGILLQPDLLNVCDTNLTRF